MAEMVETARLMGFDPSKDKDSAGFIEALEASLDMATGLVDAKVLGDGKKTSWSNRSDDPAARSQAQPQLGGAELGADVQSLGDAYRTLRDSYLDVYRSLARSRRSSSTPTSSKTKRRWPRSTT